MDENQFGKIISQLHNKQELNFVLQYVLGIVGCNFGGIRVLNEKGCIPFEHYVGFSREFWESENWLSIDHDNCVCMRVIVGKIEPQEKNMRTSYGSFYCNNTELFEKGLTEKEKSRYRGVCIKCGFKSLAVIPLRYYDHIIGTIHLADYEENKVDLAKVMFIEKAVPLIVEIIRTTSKMSYQEFLLDKINHCFIVTDYSTKVVFWNDPENIFGWPLDEVTGKEIASLNLCDNLHEILKEVNSQEVWVGENYCLRKNGDGVYVSIFVSLIKDTYEFPLGYLFVYQDITERKQASIQMQRLEQINLISQIAGGMAHEVRDPLTTVKGFLQMIKRSEDYSKYNEYYSLLINEIDKANSVLSDFIALSSINQNASNEANLNEVISLSKPIIDSMVVRNNIELHIELQELPNITINYWDIQQVVLNLIKVSIEAMPIKGNLSIKTIFENNEIILAVTYQGDGLRGKEKIGQQSINTAGQKTNLGLMISKIILNKHNGNLTIDSGPRGETFYVKFKL